MSRPRSFFRRLLFVLLLAGFAWTVTLTTWIVRAAKLQENYPSADVAIVLGASSPGGVPSSVHAARIDFAVQLYQDGTVKCLIFTGGIGRGESLANSEAARRYAVGKDVPNSAIFTETNSHTTRENLIEAKGVMDTKQLTTALLVSDPLHLFRVQRSAQRIGIEGTPAPTPYTKIRSLGEKLRFLAREFYFFHVDAFTRG